MKPVKVLAVLALAAGMVGVGAGLAMQPAGSMSRPYHNGSVWDVALVRIKPGMDSAYMTYLAGQWKAEHEALKKEGLILSYKVLSTEGHSPTDFNLILMTEFKDLASLEAGEEKMDSVVQRVIGDDKAQMQGYKERLEIREVLGNRLAREIVLEPKTK